MFHRFILVCGIEKQRCSKYITEAFFEKITMELL